MNRREMRRGKTYINPKEKHTNMKNQNTKKVSECLQDAILFSNLSHNAKMFPFVCRKNSTSDMYARRSNEASNLALFLLFSRG